MLKICYEKTEGGLNIMQWNAESEEGKSFLALLIKNGRHPVTSPPFGQYSAKVWLAISDEQLAAIKAKGITESDGNTAEACELLPGKRRGETFKASLASFVQELAPPAFIADPDPIKAAKQAGDFIDGKTRELAAAEGLSYSAAFERVRQSYPDVYARYQCL